MTNKPVVDNKNDHRQIADERRSLFSLAATGFTIRHNIAHGVAMTLGSTLV